MDEDSFTSGQILEGFDNSVTFSLFVAIVAIAVSTYLFCRSNRRMHHVHPSLMSTINDVRRGRLQQDPSAPLLDEEPVNANVDPDRVCPICLGTLSFAVLTNCGHSFCCNCFYLYWQHSGNIMRPVKCAVCRTVVTALMPTVVEGERESNVHDGVRSDEQLNDYNRRFSGAPRPWMDYIYDIPVMIPYILRSIFSFNGIMAMFRVRVIFCLVGIFVYVLFPFDILPEAVYGIFGFIDDVFVAVALLAYAILMFRRLIADRQMHFDGDVFGND